MRKHGVLQRLRSNDDTITFKPNKGSDALTVIRSLYLSQIYEIVNDKSKFKILISDPAIQREGCFQGYLVFLKKKGIFLTKACDEIYPCGSKSERTHGSTKAPKSTSNNNITSLLPRPLVSSIGA